MTGCRVAIGNSTTPDRTNGFREGPPSTLPLAQEVVQTFHVARFAMSAQQFTRGWRRTGARIEHRDVDFTSRESLIENRQITDDHGKEAEANAGLDDR